MPFTAIIVRSCTRDREGEAGPRVPVSRSCIYTGGVIHGLRAVPLHCIHILEAVIPPAVSLAWFCPASPPGPTTYFLASRWHPSHRIFSCTSCASRFASCACIARWLVEECISHNVARVLPNVLLLPVLNNASVLTPFMHTQRVYASCYIITLLLHFLRISSFLILKWTLQTRACIKQIKVKIMQSQ